MTDGYLNYCVIYRVVHNDARISCRPVIENEKLSETFIA